MTTDQLERLFRELRVETLPTIIAPGPGAARATVRRKREIRAAAGSVLAVAVVAAGIGTVRHHDLDAAAPAASPSSPPIELPTPDPVLSARADAAGKALGDPDKHPWVMATQTVLDRADYENDVNDIAQGKYRLFVYCAGPGRVTVRVEAGQYGSTVLGAGTVPCREQPAATTIEVTQPHTGYLRVFAHAENGAAGAAALAFKFVRAG